MYLYGNLALYGGDCMFCPKCNSADVSVQAVSEIQRRGCLTALLYVVLLCIPVLGWITLIVLIRGRRSETKSIGVCQGCGFRWEIKNSKQPIVIKTVVNEQKMSLIDTYQKTYFNDNKKLNVDNKISIAEVKEWLEEDIWEKGFLDIRYYISSGTNHAGENIDIDFSLEMLKLAIQKKAEYDTYFLTLLENQEKAKIIWKKVSNEIEILYNEIKDVPPAHNEEREFDTGKFMQYKNAFLDVIIELK